VAVDLAFSETGSGNPLVIAHGLFGSKRNWASIARSLSLRHRVLTVDLRNHGESPWDARHDYPALADDLARLIRTAVGGPAAVMGHSMGGKAAMTLALTEPDLVSRLVVVDIAPAPSGTSAVDFLSVMKALPLAALARRAEVDAALAESIADPAIRAFLAQNVVTTPAGLAWALNLDALDRHAGDILGFPSVAAFRPFAKPTLFIAGGRSDYIQPGHRADMQRLFPAATIETIPQAGHWVHAEAPGPFIEVVSRFLDA
jgi:esterase